MEDAGWTALSWEICQTASQHEGTDAGEGTLNERMRKRPVGSLIIGVLRLGILKEEIGNEQNRQSVFSS
jgi:hypothetical protein